MAKKGKDADSLEKKEFLKEVVVSVIGKPGEEVVNFLDPEKYVNEFIIAKKLDNNINQTRNILYKLSEHGLVSSTRKKDKKKGWYTYFWKFEIQKALEFLKEVIKKRIEQISNQIRSREKKTFYICERCGIEHNEENALLLDFTCNECGNVFSVKDNTKVLKEMKKNLEKQQRELEIVEQEIGKEKEKGEKRKIKEIKKEEDEKVRKRMEKKKERDLLKKKEMKMKKIKPKKPAKKKKKMKKKGKRK
ncbi:hypothetical protein HY449_03835 [Candidatus Pacearchaeota archaeon]|nr:hypothetical protein [Candidatus Pacearchaeota archaeon]